MTWIYPECDNCKCNEFIIQYSFDTKSLIIDCVKCRKRKFIDFLNKEEFVY